MKYYDFSADAGPHPFLIEGWAAPERGFTWTHGRHSRLRLVPPAGPGVLTLEISLTPFRTPPTMVRQRLIIAVNGHALPVETVAGECTLGWELPAALATAGALQITLHCPDAASPAARGVGGDTRLLGVAVAGILLRRGPPADAFAPRTMPPLMASGLNLPEAVGALTGLSIAELGARFESLGHDHVFGNAQRQMGAQTPSLLRYASITPHSLRRGLEDGFGRLTAPGNLSVVSAEDGYARELQVHDDAYGMNFRSGMHAHEADAAVVLRRFQRILQFLQQKFCEALIDAGKIYVFQHPNISSPAAAAALLNSLRDHGPNVLLFICSDGAEPSGTVHQLRRDLQVGWVNRGSGTGQAPRLDLAGWLSVCANAYHLHQASHGGRTD